MTALAAAAGRWPSFRIDPSTASGRARAALYVTVAGHLVLLVAFSVTLPRVGQEQRTPERLTVTLAPGKLSPFVSPPVEPAAPLAVPAPNAPSSAAVSSATAIASAVAARPPTTAEVTMPVPPASAVGAVESTELAAAREPWVARLLAPQNLATKRWAGLLSYAVAAPRRVIPPATEQVLRRLGPVSQVSETLATTNSPLPTAATGVALEDLAWTGPEREVVSAISIPYPPSMLLAAGREGEIEIRLTVGVDGSVTAVERLSSTVDGGVDAQVEQSLRNYAFTAATESSTLMLTVRFRLERAF